MSELRFDRHALHSIACGVCRLDGCIAQDVAPAANLLGPPVVFTCGGPVVRFSAVNTGRNNQSYSGLVGFWGVN